MDFLKAIFGEKALTYSELEQAINAHNGDEANKNSPIKVANLGGGEYVGKAKHDALQAQLDSKVQELAAANGLIDGFKKSEKGNETLQGRITEYQNQVEKLQEQLKQTQIDSGLRIALMEAGGSEIDFLIWKAKNENGGKPLELTEEGKIKGIDDMISGLKTSSPAYFKKANGIVVEANPLPTPKQGGSTVTKEEFSKMGYNSRVELRQNNPELYDSLMKG